MAERSSASRREHQARLREEFSAGVRCMREEDYDGALTAFRALDEHSDFDDDLLNRYTSYHGLTRVLSGDASGVKLCRKAAVGNAHDAEVLFNLALAEHRLQYRESAYLALRRGLRLDPEHPGLLRLKREIVLREQHGMIPFLSREHFINAWLGRLLRRVGRKRTG
jgi:tetratricopeptide (TPR) repeat protein